jgi:SHS2 domain-containing protein
MYIKDTSKFHEIEHTADIGLEIVGDTPDKLFANAAFGMYYLLYGDLKISENYERFVRLKEATLPDLFVAWLSEINYILMVENFIANKIVDMTVKSREDSHTLEAKLSGDHSRKYEDYMQTEIKAVTYHGLSVKKRKNGFWARVIFDI